jgi:hypothetical protein
MRLMNCCARQLNAIKMATIARYAGDYCPRYRVIESATFEELRDGEIPPALLSTPAFKNAMMMAFLGAAEQNQKSPDEFCLAAGRLFGPSGVYRRQMLEAN